MTSRQIYLATIVKNESKNIARMLTSVAPVISGGLICDTGSTDDTINIIHYTSQKLNKPIDIVKTEFRNFEYARNLNLQYARNKFKTGYLLLADADMELRIGSDFDSSLLTKDCYFIRQKTFTDCEYYNPRLLSVNTTAKYVGVTHEYLDLSGHSVDFLDTVYFVDYASGSNRTNKFDRDINLILSELSGSLASRYMFYLAQSYKDKHDLRNAIIWYSARIGLGDSTEEVYYSYCMRAACYRELSDEANCVYDLLNAVRVNPHRPEAWYHLAVYFRTKGDYKRAYEYAINAMNATPSKNALFLNTSIKTEFAPQEVSICGYYTKDNDKIETSRKVCIDLMSDGYISQRTRLAAEHNFEYYHRDITHIFKDIEFSRIVPMNFATFKPGNATMCYNYLDNSIDFLQRYVNYSWRDNKAVCIINNPVYNVVESKYTYNKLFSLDTENVDLRLGVILKNKDLPLDTCSNIRGIEDIRLWRNNDKLFGIGASAEYSGFIQQVFFDIDLTSYEIKNIKLLDSPDNKVEKNWVPCVFNNISYIVYKWSPITVYVLNTTTGRLSQEKIIKEVPRGLYVDNWRGSSQLVYYDDSFIGVIHFVVFKSAIDRFYYHRFVRLDLNFNLVAYTEPFYFKQPRIEYCTGLLINNNCVYVNFSVSDAESFICKIPKQAFDLGAWRYLPNTRLMIPAL